jgi:hypothetical protein
MLGELVMLVVALVLGVVWVVHHRRRDDPKRGRLSRYLHAGKSVLGPEDLP